ncbi:BrnA antitoxin family protein [Bordetella sp. FB-8]|uniref:BrnA antitoxin family protein n=1 Tax=Bordetella sp. FB-8 TaxID=1159870 RepID=UPI00039FCB5B|nr:BrnA antitoxin family protein [Bordetella sp. FB-8]
MPKLKPGHISPTPKEDALIRKQIEADPDAWCPTDEEWERIKPTVRAGVGRPKAEATQERIAIRLSPGVLETFRASGAGWQTRIDAALRDWLRTHKLG